MTRLIRVSDDLLEVFGTRTDSGARLTAVWGEPDAEGVYEPVFTVHIDDPGVQDMKDGAALRRLREADEADTLEDEATYDVEVYIWRGHPVLVQLVVAGGAIAEGRGATIAEAADACRAALDG